MRELIKAGINLDYIIYAHTPLTLSIIKEQFEIAHLLVDGGADVNIPEKMACRRLPLHMVARLGLYDLVTKMVNHGADINAHDAASMTALHWAALEGHFKVVDWLINAGAEVDPQDEVGHTPLFRAVEGAHLEVVKLLCGAGASVNVEGKYLWTPLFHSVVCNDFDMVKDLISNGASVQHTNIIGQTALHLIANRLATDNLLTLCRTDSDFYLRDRQLSCFASKRAVDRACCEFEMEIAELLIDSGADVDCLNHLGETPFFVAAREADVSLMRLFIRAGSNLEKETWIEERNWPVKLMPLTELCEWLGFEWENRFRSLQNLCKNVIRKSVGAKINSRLRQLTLPSKLLDYLTLVPSSGFKISF